MKFTDKEKELGKEMALAVNGGDWGKDYTDAHKTGWYLKARWAIENKDKL